ncbi:MAG: T9SS type A sorting domain-containing protein, partial [candidate division KSB1 bacterium]|nr:T9SS type A sorting domain-containing protein [candidate division KSB1 bacterium]
HPVSNAVIQLYNINGQLVYTQTVGRTSRQHSLTMSTNGTASGVYLLRITGTNWHLSRTVLIIN